MIYDIIVLGGGPAGYTAAGRAGRAGLNTLLIERNAVGGVCLNEGCIPTKTLLYSAKNYDHAKEASKYGLDISANGFDMGKIISRKNKIVRKLVAGIKAGLKDANVTTMDVEASVLERTAEGIIRIQAGEEIVEGKHLLLCTGSETFIPPIKGLETCEYMTSREALDLKELPKSLAIVGGGVIGMEFASFYNSMGVEVSVIEMLPEIINGMDTEMADMLRKIYEKKGIKFYLSHRVTEFQGQKILLEAPDHSQVVVEPEAILLSVGRRPVTTAFDVLGLEYDNKRLKVNLKMQTSLPNVYAAGDVTGFSLLAHTAVREAEVAIDNILGHQEEISYAAIPGVVYTNPEIAGVGMTEDKLKAEGITYTAKSLSLSFSGRFVAENEMGNGLIKMLFDADGAVIGCHILGNPAGELIVIAGMAIEMKMKAKDLERIIFPHPTVAEIIKENVAH